jgi:hypothetical protein
MVGGVETVADPMTASQLGNDPSRRINHPAIKLVVGQIACLTVEDLDHGCAGRDLVRRPLVGSSDVGR